MHLIDMQSKLREHARSQTCRFWFSTFCGFVDEEKRKRFMRCKQQHHYYIVKIFSKPTICHIFSTHSNDALSHSPITKCCLLIHTHTFYAAQTLFFCYDVSHAATAACEFDFFCLDFFTKKKTIIWIASASADTTGNNTVYIVHIKI